MFESVFEKNKRKRCESKHTAYTTSFEQSTRVPTMENRTEAVDAVMQEAKSEQVDKVVVDQNDIDRMLASTTTVAAESIGDLSTSVDPSGSGTNSTVVLVSMSRQKDRFVIHGLSSSHTVPRDVP